MSTLGQGPAAGTSLAPFDEALREVNSRLLAAHSAAVATVEAELQRMRSENTRLRMLLAEAGVQLPVKQSATGELVSSLSACGSMTAPSSAQGQALLGAQASSPVSATATGSMAKSPNTPASAPSSAQSGSCSGIGGSRSEAAPSEDLVQPEIIEEVVRPGVAGSAAGSNASPSAAEARPAFYAKPCATGIRDVTPQDSLELARALGTVLQHHGLQHLPVSQQADKGTWTVAGVAFMLRLDGCDLLASCDVGRNWALLEALIVQFLPQLQAQDREAASRKSSQVQRPVPKSSQEYVRRQEASASPASQEASWAGTVYSGLVSEPLTGGAARAGEGGLPVWRSDGLPAFNNAFPQAFDALSGSSQYYSQFRVRVPTVSQYESFEQDG